jgi:hypothetical protein
MGRDRTLVRVPRGLQLDTWAIDPNRWRNTKKVLEICIVSMIEADSDFS